MLVLTRKNTESIVIGTNAEVTVKILGIDKNNVRLGVSAPRQLPVHREEIYLKIQDEQTQTTN
jgi:carbon storage regulator